MAEKFGYTPASKDEKIRLVLADGREIDAWKMKATSIRVGKFTVQNVDIAVLGPEAIAAEPILGMSFLQNFQFEVDSANRTLTMVKLADEK
jgi:aspartyl protease family protein